MKSTAAADVWCCGCSFLLPSPRCVSSLSSLSLSQSHHIGLSAVCVCAVLFYISSRSFQFGLALLFKVFTLDYFNQFYLFLPSFLHSQFTASSFGVLLIFLLPFRLLLYSFVFSLSFPIYDLCFFSYTHFSTNRHYHRHRHYDHHISNQMSTHLSAFSFNLSPTVFYIVLSSVGEL